MKRKLATLAAGLVAFVALASGGALRAHHSVRMIDVSTAVWIKGTVVSYRAVSPHTLFELDETKADGQVQRWTIEGPFPGRLSRILSLNGMQADAKFLQPGDVVEVCGFFPKRAISPNERLPLSHVHGHVVIMPDGRMQSWGPYGKLDNCVRPNDRPESWLRFLNADPLLREFWCNVPAFTGVASAAPQALVDDVNRQLPNGCN
jgi:hypothetical protein